MNQTEDMPRNPHWKKRAILFLISQCISLFGSSVVSFAIVWYVTLKTSSGVMVSAISICSFVPQMLISFLSGVWADRFSRKKLIILSDSIIAVSTLLLALLISSISADSSIFAALLIISVIRSLGAGVQTPAVSAMVTQLVPQQELVHFNGINAAIQYAVQFIAPAAAGAILSYLSFHSSLLLDVITAIIGISILALIPIPALNQPVSEKPASVKADLKEAFSYAVHSEKGFLGWLLLSFGLFIFLSVPTGFQASLFVSREYGNSYWYLTLVEVVGFAGMAAGGLLMGTWGGFSTQVKTYVLSIGMFGLLCAAMGVIQQFIIYLVLMVILGIALTMVQTSMITLIQKNTIPEMQGRIFSFQNILYCGATPLGMAVFGPLADVMSMRLLMIITGSFLGLSAFGLCLNKGFFQHE